MQRFISNLFEPKTNGPETAALLAALLSVDVSATTLRKDIEEHPDNPSLLSISDVLNSYGIENLAIKTDAGKLSEIPLPCITQIQATGADFKYFTVVKEITDSQVRFFDSEKHQWTAIAKDDFASRFSEIVLLAQAGEKAGEKDYAEKIKTEKRVRLGQYILTLCLPALLLSAGILAFAQVGSGAVLPFIFSVFTLAGCAISTLLLWYEVDQYNPALHQICSSGTKVNCGAVLQSKAAKIAGISWSVVGFSYFMGLLLLPLFLGLASPVTLFTASWGNALALPYIFFSIYYQWHIVKQWCMLCLGVQGLLALQFAAALIGGWHGIMPFSTLFTPVVFLQALAAFAIPLIVSAILLPALQKAKESKELTIKLQKLKHNRQVFEALLPKQKEVTAVPAGLGITLGNPNAAYKLIKVCNPYCTPCAKAHQPMEDLLDNNPDVQVQILFVATNDEHDNRTPPVKHLLAIAETGNETVTKHALDDWYFAETKDYGQFAGKYPMNGELNRQAPKIAEMKAWCDSTKIEFTPTFFVALASDESNGQATYYQLPEMYSVSDLKYFFTV
ncbi:vitamin K epoxide reductase family protein [Mucilaginibacter xinganensis]|uniref:Protein-disulfide isomerase n=1 Tax=Mucilaginibacter xinganensis TaxID=1234841 RepID=A0A223P365_9SPHI|nr:vitamin K epoxide reductase family protein [Mucilaginibacter xinganensis]ASU36555.1 Protein-disulfide isomerase [Mucilaginibacter xinganensis]